MKPRPTAQTLKDLAESLDTELTVFDDLAGCAVGYCTVAGDSSAYRVVYAAERIVRHFQRQGMSYEDAQEYAEFNVFQAYVGPQTPVILHRIPEWMLREQD